MHVKMNRGYSRSMVGLLPQTLDKCSPFTTKGDTINHHFSIVLSEIGAIKLGTLAFPELNSFSFVKDKKMKENLQKTSFLKLNPNWTQCCFRVRARPAL